MESCSDYLPFTLLQRSIISPCLAVLLTVLLEWTCQREARTLYASNPALYWSAWWANIRNNVGLGGLTYYMTVRYIACRDNHYLLLSLGERVQAGVGIAVIQSVVYYILHKAFHEVKGLYWIHCYHHKFNTVVCPSSANAVSVAEYLIAYMFPLWLGVVCTGADEVATFCGPVLPVIANLLIHTPWMESYCYPWIFVSPRDHLQHHGRSAKNHYGAPIFHLDRILQYISSGLDSTTGKSKRM